MISENYMTRPQKRERSRSRIMLVIMLVFIFLYSGCDNTHSRGNVANKVPSRISAEAEEDSTKPVVYFGFITRYNPRIMYEEYQPIMDYLSAQTPYRFEIRLGKTYQDAVEFLRDGKVQIASFGAVTYVEAHHGFNAVPILKPLNENGQPYYRSLIVVRKESAIQTLKDLRGKTFAFASVHSTSGNLLPRYNLVKVGITLDDLASYTNLKHHDSVAKSVLAGEYDAGAVKDIIAYKYLAKGLRILHSSGPIPSVPLVVRPDCDPRLIQSVKKALLKIDIRKPEYRQLVSNWNKEFRNGFVETGDADYRVIREMLNAIPGSCGNSCHPVRIF